MNSFFFPPIKSSLQLFTQLIRILITNAIDIRAKLYNLQIKLKRQRLSIDHQGMSLLHPLIFSLSRSRLKII